jgi:hypothetical protein
MGGPLVPAELLRRFVSHQLRIKGERDIRLSALTGGRHPEGGILGQSLRVVGVLVARQAGIDGLAQ